MVVPGIKAVHWKFSMYTATRTSSYSPFGLSVFFCVFSLGLHFVYSFVSLICLCVPIVLCFPGQLSHLPYSFWR